MSSRIHREDPETVAEPLAYRHFSRTVGGSAAEAGTKPLPKQTSGHHTVANQTSAHQTPTAESIAEAEQFRKQIETRIKEAHARGQAEAERGAAARVEPILKSFQSMVEQLSQQSGRVRAAAEEDVVKLSVAIARRVLRRELATDPDAVLGLVKAAMAKLQAREIRRLRVAPPDAALIAAQRAGLDFPQGVEIVSDASLGPGSAIFETTRGELDASLETQLAEIDRGLTDVLRRRS